MIDTEQQALAFLREHGVVSLGKHPGVPSLIEALAGEPVRGSWWSHRRGKRIFALMAALMDSGEVASVKLLDGKVTFVHRDRWPALYRLVSDRAFRAGARATLGAAAGKLFAAVERRGELRLDEEVKRLPLSSAAAKQAKDQLERSLLVHAEQAHTDAGHHAMVLRSWRRWAARGVAAQARKLTLARARALLGLS